MSAAPWRRRSCGVGSSARNRKGSVRRLRRGRPSPALAGMQLEHHAGDLDVVAGRKAGGLERADDAHPPQPSLDVGERLVVVEVVAREQADDALAVDAEGAVAGALDAEAAARRGPEDAV